MYVLLFHNAKQKTEWFFSLFQFKLLWLQLHKNCITTKFMLKCVDFYLKKIELSLHLIKLECAHENEGTKKTDNVRPAVRSDIDLV